MNKFEQAAALLSALRRLEMRHDRKMRRAEERAAKLRSAVTAWFDASVRELLSDADPEVREMVEGEWQDGRRE